LANLYENLRISIDVFAAQHPCEATLDTASPSAKPRLETSGRPGYSFAVFAAAAPLQGQRT
jgi:hypothetical protein